MPLLLYPDKIDSSLNTYRVVFSDPLKSGNDNGFEGGVLLPLDFSLEMDGIGGIIPHSTFTIPSNSLPETYKIQTGPDQGKQRIAFILHTIEQNFGNNKWSTRLTGQVLNIRFEPLTQAEKDAITNAKGLTYSKTLALRAYPKPTLNNSSTITGNNNSGFTPSSGNVVSNSYFLWLYLLWQQGDRGAPNIYNVAKGVTEKFDSDLIRNLPGNFPGGKVEVNGIKRGDIEKVTALFNTSPENSKLLAQTFIESWVIHINNIQTSLTFNWNVINSDGKNRNGIKYSVIKDLFIKHQDLSINLTWEILAQFALIENSFGTDTKRNGKGSDYFSMFQMSKEYFPEANRRLKTGVSARDPSFDDYHLEGTIIEAVKLIRPKWEGFLKKTKTQSSDFTF